LVLSLTALSQVAFGQAPPAPDTEPAAAAPAPPPAPAQPVTQPPPADLPPPPPPKTAPPPPPQGKVAISAPPVPPAQARRGYHIHDGFYLRMGLGLGGGRVSISTDQDTSKNYQLGGAGVAYNLWLGGTPWNGLAMGGLVSVQQMSDGDVRAEGGSTDEGMEGRLALIGMFIDAFPDPQRGLHFGGSLALAGINTQADNKALEDQNVDNYDAGGLGGAAWVGYMGFVGPEWSLGGMLQLSYGFTRKEQQDLTRQASGGALSLSFTALYH
jgi:hypothetical protein